MTIAYGDPVMADLETLGTSPNSVILSIGAVKFDPETHDTHSDFYMVANKQSCLDIGMTIDSDTLRWWTKQSEDARKVLADAEVSPHSIQDVLRKFADWITPETCIWGNGSDFDNAMMQEAYRKAGIPQPWMFWNNRCYRTMKNQVNVFHKRTGTHHNALDDARHQAEHLMKILDKLRG